MVLCIILQPAPAFADIHYGLVLLREQRQGMYALTGLPGNLSMTVQHIAAGIHTPGEGEALSRATTTPELSSAEAGSLSMRCIET